MKQTQCISLIGLTLSISTVLAANPAIPERQSSGRYDKITEDWPFAIETPPVSAPANLEGPFTNIFVSGIARTYENGREEVFVAISSKDKQTSFSLFGSGKGHDDICVAGFEWDDHIGRSRVTLKKGNETGSIGFDEMAIRTPAAATRNPALPTSVPMMPPRTLKPNRAIPQPVTVPPQSGQQTPGANPPMQPHQGTDPARGGRIRVIR